METKTLNFKSEDLNFILTVLQERMLFELASIKLYTERGYYDKYDGVSESEDIMELILLALECEDIRTESKKKWAETIRHLLDIIYSYRRVFCKTDAYKDSYAYRVYYDSYGLENILKLLYSYTSIKTMPKKYILWYWESFQKIDRCFIKRLWKQRFVRNAVKKNR